MNGLRGCSPTIYSFFFFLFVFFLFFFLIHTQTLKTHNFLIVGSSMTQSFYIMLYTPLTLFLTVFKKELMLSK